MVERGFFAHTPGPDGEWQDLRTHLINVAQKAREFASSFGMADVAYIVGLFHDLGKYNPSFQAYLRAQAEGRQHPKVPHAIWGAALMYMWIYIHQRSHLWEEFALPILGHHTGLADAGQAAIKMHDFFRNSAQELSDVLKYWQVYHGNLPRLTIVPKAERTERELLIRMLFSALVDADYLDTERHFEPIKAQQRGSPFSLESLWKKFESNHQKFMQGKDDTLVNRVRREVYALCIKAAEEEPGLFRLTVPTGGGKTRSGMAFALKHALKHGLKRIIVAIPYTSIIDQTAQIYREIFGDEAVLEHHSAVQFDDDEAPDERFIRQRLASENWDAPIVVTTTVQLFESLFSNRPSKVRKIHRLSRAVIILDEVQTLPPELLVPTFDVLKQLTKPVENGGYGSTVVFSTATQPAFDDERWVRLLSDVSIKEIVPSYRDHFAVLKRVNYQFRENPLSWDALAEEIQANEQVLVVLNTRKDALALLKALDKTPDMFHLSTLLCSAHRKKILADIRERLKNKRPIRLISTQVVEAGVDLDFPIVYRAIGPLDRIVQAAGRCNREGKLPEGGTVIIFEPEEGSLPKGPYKVGFEKAKLLLYKYPTEALHDPEIYAEYFGRLYDDLNLDEKDIQAYRENFNYPEVDARYKLIDQDTVTVVVPYGEARERLSDWLSRPGPSTWCALQPYTIQLYRHETHKRRDWLEELSNSFYRWTGGYDPLLGIVEGFSDPSDLIVG